MSSHMRFNNASARSCPWVTKKPSSTTGLEKRSWKAAQQKRSWGCWWTAADLLAFLPTWARCHLPSSPLLPSTMAPFCWAALKPLYSEAIPVHGVLARQQQPFLTRASCLQEQLLNDIVTSTLWHKFWGCFPCLAAYPSSSSAFLRCRGSVGFQHCHKNSHNKRNELSSVWVGLAISV